MQFSKQSLEFLFENYMRNDKCWFNEHREDYKHFVVEPFADFINRLAPSIAKIDSTLSCTPRRISRIYRDARYSRDTIFRDTVWCSIMHGSELYDGLPGFFVEFSPRLYRYGLGYYKASAKSNEALRELILKKDKSYTSAYRAFKRQDVFELGGDLYKRDHFPEITDERNGWLNCRSMCFLHTSEDFERFFSADFAESVAEDFLKLAPEYSFLMTAERNVRAGNEAVK